MPCRALALALTLFALAPAAAEAADRTKPTTPTNLRATAVTGDTATFAWNPSTDNSGSFSYTLQESAGWGWWVPQTQTTYTATGLQPGRTYRFVVYATDAAGNRSANSNQVTVTTPAAAPPAVPAGLRATATTPNSVSLAWDAAANAARYEIQNRGTSFTTTFTAEWLQPDTSYTFAVRSINAAGAASAWSAPIAVRTPRDTTAPSAPVVSVDDVSYSSVSLSWTPSSDDSNSVSYNVYVDGRPSPQMLPPGPTSMDVLSLRDGTTYVLSVAAYDAAGNFSAPTHVTVTTPVSPDTMPPPAPTNLVATAESSHVVRLGWGPWSGFADTFAHEIWMDGAFVREIQGDWRYSGMLFPGGTVRHLAPGSTHAFTVYNRDEAGNLSAPSDSVTVTLPPSADTTPPAAPTFLTGDTSPNCAFAFFSWDGSGEAEIYEDGHFLDVWRDEAFMTSFGRHAYTVRLVDLAGNTSEPSPPATLDHGNRC